MYTWPRDPKHERQMKSSRIPQRRMCMDPSWFTLYPEGLGLGVAVVPLRLTTLPPGRWGA